MVTGASGFIGGAVTERLLPRYTVRSLTSHSQKNQFGDRVRSVAYDFERPERMDEAFAGADTFVHSYYIRFPHSGDTFERAVTRAGILIDRARRAGVRRIVHVSVSNANEASGLPYYRNKGRLERLVRESGLDYAILRPALVFGPGDILLNNIAWFLRRAPIFGIFGDGVYRVQPVSLDGFGALIVEAIQSSGSGAITDVAGPIDYRYLDMVRLIRDAVGSRAALVRMPEWLALSASWATGFLVRDVILTRDEARGLTEEYLYSENPRRIGESLETWLTRGDVRDFIGRSYVSELQRHFR